MSSISLSNADPLILFSKFTETETYKQLYDFLTIMKDLYQYQIFKNLLDLTATKIRAGSLQFEVCDKKFFELQSGSCNTAEGGKFNKILNFFKNERFYTIKISKVKIYIIAHELAHMLEKEAELFINDTDDYNIQSALKNDAQFIPNASISLQSAFQAIMIEEVAQYHPSNYGSEIFARYFELLALSKEIAGYEKGYVYTIEEIETNLPNLSQWIKQYGYSKNIIKKIDQDIADYSVQYVKSPEDIDPSWSGKRFQSIHDNSKNPQWTKTVKSIKEES